MAALETRLQILAEDATAGAFASVAARIEGLQAKIAEVSATAGATVGRANIASAAAAEPTKAAGTGGIVGDLAGLAMTITGAKLAMDGYSQSVDQAHERVRMSMQGGMPEGEIAEAEKISQAIAEKYPVMKPSDVMEMLRDARANTGNFDDAKAIIDDVAKLWVVTKAQHPDANAQELNDQFGLLIKGMDIKGVVQNMDAFKKYMEGFAKTANAFGGVLTPSDLYAMIKYSRQASLGLSDDFMLGVAPTIASELKGSSAGKAFAAFNRAIVGGFMEHSAYQGFFDAGLLSEDDVDRTKTGEIKGLKAGHHFRDVGLAQSDPYAWVRDDLLPGLAKQGITDPEAIRQWVTGHFTNQGDAQLVGIFATQQQKIERDRKLQQNAKGLDSAGNYLKDDPKVAAMAAGGAWVTSIAKWFDPAKINALMQFFTDTGTAHVPSFWQSLTSLPRDITSPKPHFVNGAWRLPGDHSYALADAGYRDAQSSGWWWNRTTRPSDLSLEQGREASRGRALSGMTPLDVTGKVTLDPASKASVSVDVRVEAGDGLLKFVTNAIASSSGNIAASLGRMDGDAAPRRAAGFGAH